MNPLPNTIEYRLIPGFPNYRAGSDGTLWRYRRNRKYRNDRLRQLHPTPCKRSRYLKVQLTDESGRKVQNGAHVFVLLAFHGPCPEGMEGCHENGVRSDNRSENLRWDTHRNNMADLDAHGTKLTQDRHPNAVATREIAAQVIVLLAQGVFQKEIATQLGVSQQLVSLIKTGQHWTQQEAAA